MTDLSHTTILAAQRGEVPAQQQLYRGFASYVLGVCLLYARDRAEAEDWAQDTWVRALTQLGSFRAEGPFQAWLRTLAVTTCLKKLRRKRPHVLSLAATDFASNSTSNPGELARQAYPHVDPSVISQLSAEELLTAIQALPEGFRLVFTLVAVEGYSHAETAELLGISESSSRSQLTRARRSLQQRLANLLAQCLL